MRAEWKFTIRPAETGLEIFLWQQRKRQLLRRKQPQKRSRLKKRLQKRKLLPKRRQLPKRRRKRQLKEKQPRRSQLLKKRRPLRRKRLLAPAPLLQELSKLQLLRRPAVLPPLDPPSAALPVALPAVQLDPHLLLDLAAEENLLGTITTQKNNEVE